MHLKLLCQKKSMKSMLSFSLILSLGGCSKSDSDPAPATTEPPVTVSTGAVLNTGVAALSSVGSLSLGLEEAELRLLEEEETVSDRDSHCSDNGTAMKADGERMTESDPEYARTVMYCAALFNAGSPDSVLGAISVAGILTCELERAEAWTSDDDFTTDGNNVGEVTVVLTNECAEDWQIERLTEGGENSFPLQDVTLIKLADTHGYDKKIAFSMGEEEGPSTFSIRNSNGFIAAKSANWAFSIDTVNSIVRYETLGESVDRDNDSTYVRRIRLKISGDLDSDGSFSEVTDVKGLKLEGFGVEETWAELVTISGNKDGLITNLYYKNGLTNNEFTAEENVCSAEDCSEVTAIAATEAQIDAFHASAAEDFLVHDAEEGIVATEEVDLSANVTYDAHR
ncbi:MAG: hypothetical protein KBD78_07470 [Oligoflexales bacterium]|nr:hypothetical protein [Oligoflexales bacterium]